MPEPKPRRGRPMSPRPYVPDSVQAPAGRQHALIRRLGSRAIGDPAIGHILDAADEIAAEVGKTPDKLSDAEADRAIELGDQRHREETRDADA